MENPNIKLDHPDGLEALRLHAESERCSYLWTIYYRILEQQQGLVANCFTD